MLKLYLHCNLPNFSHAQTPVIGTQDIYLNHIFVLWNSHALVYVKSTGF